MQYEVFKKRIKTIRAVLLTVGCTMLLLSAIWLLFMFSLKVYSSISFDHCEKNVTTEVVLVNVESTFDKRTELSDDFKQSKYYVVTYKGTYNGVTAEYTPDDIDEKVQTGLSEAVYMKGTVKWYDKEIPFAGLSIKSFPGYNEKKAYDPHSLGSKAIYDTIMGEAEGYNTFSWVCLVFGMLIVAAGVLTHKLDGTDDE